jgi:hypothetical protein
MNAYRISTGIKLNKGDAISARRNGKWQRAFFVRVIDTSTIEGVFDGDLVVNFEGVNGESYVRPHGTHDVMVRSN